MFTIAAVTADAALGAHIAREYMADVASRWYGRPATEDELSQALRDEPDDDLQGATGMLLVAVEGGRPLGCAGIRFLGSVAELTKVFTLPSYRGRGIGSQLLRARVDPFSDEPYSDRWYSKELAASV